jgi:hypothetical protein
MCELCDGSLVEWNGDVTERLNLLEEALAYNDEPLYGIAVCRECEASFVFWVDSIASHVLWHWSLVPISKTIARTSVNREWNELLEIAKTQLRERWLSMVVDARVWQRRTCKPTWMKSACVQPRF